MTICSILILCIGKPSRDECDTSYDTSRDVSLEQYETLVTFYFRQFAKIG